MSKWFGVRCVFRHRRSDAPPLSSLYEERVVLVRAESFDDAIRQAEEDASDYSSDDGVEFLSFLQAFEIYDDPSAPPAEVFSLMRESDLDADSYIDAFFATGRERERSKGGGDAA